MAERYPLPDDSVSADVNVRQVLWTGLAMLIIVAVIVAAVFLAGETLVAIKPAPTALPPPSSPAVTAPSRNSSPILVPIDRHSRPRNRPFSTAMAGSTARPGSSMFQ